MAAALDFYTTWGVIRVTSSDGLITSCNMPGLSGEPRTPFSVRAVKIRNARGRDAGALRGADRFLRSLFRGRKSPMPSLALPEASRFTRNAWQAMLRVPRGSAITYAELARRAGSPRASRAAGSACARNMIPLFIPCHRILAGGGRLGGFSCGLAWKKFLLEAEGLAR